MFAGCDSQQRSNSSNSILVLLSPPRWRPLRCWRNWNHRRRFPPPCCCADSPSDALSKALPSGSILLLSLDDAPASSCSIQQHPKYKRWEMRRFYARESIGEAWARSHPEIIETWADFETPTCPSFSTFRRIFVDDDLLHSDDCPSRSMLNHPSSSKWDHTSLLAQHGVAKGNT